MWDCPIGHLTIDSLITGHVVDLAYFILLTIFNLSYFVYNLNNFHVKKSIKSLWDLNDSRIICFKHDIKNRELS